MDQPAGQAVKPIDHDTELDLQHDRSALPRNGDMDWTATEILTQLGKVDALRREQGSDPILASRVRGVKAYQARRFRWTYADLLLDPRYQPAAEFFLAELYGPRYFVERDAQFARIVPTLSKRFPSEVTETVGSLSLLHAVSEELDHDMARHLVAVVSLGAMDYRRAWRATGRPQDRQLQIDLTIHIGHSLERYTRSPVLAGALRMMRLPARAAGLADLQRFLEAGFDAFRAMGDTTRFFDVIRHREERLAAALFSVGTESDELAALQTVLPPD